MLESRDTVDNDSDVTFQRSERNIYVTTTGRVTGQPREIEIWFVEWGGKLYILAERFFNAQWVKNIERNPRIQVRLSGREFHATARVLDQEKDDAAWRMAQRLARAKYGWGEGLPVEITPDCIDS